MKGLLFILIFFSSPAINALKKSNDPQMTNANGTAIWIILTTNSAELNVIQTKKQIFRFVLITIYFFAIVQSLVLV